jgi:hypothetical protein
MKEKCSAKATGLEAIKFFLSKNLFGYDQKS